MSPIELGQHNKMAKARKRARRASQTKRARKRTKTAQHDASEDEGNEDEEVYDVEAIVGKKGNKYCIKWKGYEEVTWESTENLTNCKELIRKFEEDNAKKDGGPQAPKEPATTLISAKPTASASSVPASNEVMVTGPLCEANNSANEEEAGHVMFIDEETKESENFEAAEDRTRASRSTANRMISYASKSDDESDSEDAEAGENAPTRDDQLLDVLTDVAEARSLQTQAAKSKKSVQARGGRTLSSKSAVGGIERSLIGKLVAYSPRTDTWMVHKAYEVVGSTYITERICNFIYSKKQGLYEIRWLDSMFQNRVEKVDLHVVKIGRQNFEKLNRYKATPRWTRLCQPEPGCEIDMECEIDDLVEFEAFDSRQNVPVSLSEVEQIKNMTFDPDASMRSPTLLHTSQDGSIDTQVKQEFQHLFEHSASASFFAYLPVYFWKQVLEHTNEQAKAKKLAIGEPFTIHELMTFLGVMWFMSAVDKGEYANYWGEQVESAIFGASSCSLDTVMPLRRLKALRSAFSFRRSSEITEVDLKRDSAVRVRPLLNVLKLTGSRYVDVGRNLAVDEASVASRSKYARHLIVYNPRKPTGKYHFKLYMCCCATSWIALNFRLHCESTLEDRLENVADGSEIQDLREDIKDSAKTRQIVLEIVRPFYDTFRIVNCDNYYTSVQLLEALRLKGLYCRGTVKRLSKHFPRHVVLGEPNKADKNANKSKNKRTIGSNDEVDEDEREVEGVGQITTAAGPVARIDGEVKRGDYLQAVSKQHKIVAASWCDGNIVTIISNADATTISTVKRLVKGEKVSVPAPTCIKEYNQHMQGVDRNDQVRARFSVADGHSFKKWYKKLGLAIIDIARVNAFLTRRLYRKEQCDERDSHRRFLIELIQEMISGRWQDAPSDDAMLFGDADQFDEMRSPRAPTASPATPSRVSSMQAFSPASNRMECSGVESMQIFGQTRRKRMCIICRLEGRKDTVTTEFCVEHKVCLCKRVYPDATNAYGCQRTEWTCWEKFHKFYIDKDVFTKAGCVKRTSAIFKEKKMWEAEESRQRGGNRAASDRSLSYTEYDMEVPTPSSVDPATPAPSFTGTVTPTPSFDFSSHVV